MNDAPEFHSLRVVEVKSETSDSVSVTFDVPIELSTTFRYLPGQHMTLRAFVDGEDVRRSYSICANAVGGKLRVGVRAITRGKLSNWVVNNLAAGDWIDVMPPIGAFTIEPDPGRRRQLGFIAAGAGITPILSLLSTTLEVEPATTCTLIFANRESRSIMFLDEVEGLKDRYPERFQLIHVLSREPQLVPLLSGRLDREKLEEIFDRLVPFADIDEWFLCGPYGLVENARQVIEGRGVPRKAVHDELFFAEPLPDQIEEAEDTEGFTEVNFTLDGRSSQVLVDPAGLSILDHALRVRRELPFSCKGGICATCKARLVEGEVRMDENWALVADELAAGFVLTCQSHPLTPKVELDYDV